MTPYEARAALQAALDNDDALAARFAAASNEAEFKAIADEVGVDWVALSSPLHSEDEVSGDLTDVELGSMSGGFIPRTDWFTCDGVKPPWFQ